MMATARMARPSPNTKMGDRRKRCDRSAKKIHMSDSKHRKPTSMITLVKAA